MIENNLMRSIERHEKQVTTRVAAMMMTNWNRKMAVSDACDRKLTARGIDEHAHARGGFIRPAWKEKRNCRIKFLCKT